MPRRVEELKAKISVEDNASKNLEKITKMWQRQENQIKQLKAQMTRLREENKRLRDGLSKKMDIKVDTKQAEHNVNRLERVLKGLRATAAATGRGMMNMFSGIRNMMPGIGTIAAVAGGGYMSKQIFDATFGNAAEYEQSQAVITAMFRDKQKAQKYMETMSKMAISSPLLNSQDIFSNSKSFIALTKNQDQLNKMWDLAERLLAVDPKQGVEGAVFALRELFSGDSQSLAERFELSKKVLNQIKKMDLKDQLTALDKYFTKMGMTRHLVNQMGNTTLGVWNQIKEVSDVAFRKMGDPAVKIIKPFLDDMNQALNNQKKISPYIKFGQDMAKGIAKGFVSISKSVGKWIDSIVNDPEFQRLNSINQKFDFILDKVAKSFVNWWDGSGKATITDVTSGIIDTMISGLEKNIPRIADVGIRIGMAVAGGIVKGIASIDIPSPLDLLDKAANKVWNIGSDYIKGIFSSKKSSSKASSKKSSAPRAQDMRLMHTLPRAIGVRRITKDNTLIRAHEGETLLTKQESKQLKYGGNFTIEKIADTIIVREEADIDKIVQKIVDRYKKESVRLGGAW
jgi:TolA-binding protein